MIGDGNQVLGAGRLADEHGAVVVLLADGLKLGDLIVDLCACGGVLRADHHELVVVTLQHGGKLRGNELIGNQAAGERIQAQHIADAVHLLHLVRHLANVGGRGVAVQQQQVQRAHMEVVPDGCIGLGAVQFIGQRGIEVVVDAGVIVAVNRGHQQNQEQDNEQLIMLHNPAGKTAHIRKNGLMGGLLDGLVEHQDQCRQNRNAADDAEHNALCHHDAQVKAQGKAHEAQGNEACHGSHGAAQYRGEGGCNGMGHSLFLGVIVLQVLREAVPQEDGVVHGNAQLQNRRQGHGDVGYLSCENVCAQVIQDCHADTGDKQQRQHQGVHRDGQHHTGQQHCNEHIDGFLLLGQITGVGDGGRHAADQRPLSGNLLQLAQSLQGFVTGGTAFEEHQHHGAVVGVEFVQQVVGQNLLGNRQACDAAVPQHICNAVYLRKLFPHFCYVLVVHALDHNHGVGALTEFVLQDFLPYHGVDVIRQISQNIIVDSGCRITQHGWNQQQQGNDQDQNPVLCDKPSKLYHGFVCLLKN